ncbi:MAG: ribosome maturation factor RimM [Bacteroidetes bacterium]|nr:ribosome maturation factor RimM [Bacteroidota bacterium]MDA0889045.1 ribosome maturation factor RimM [Bacteroidota bacterium]MDA1084940.1 ribosome maturation factor RimM [Bacteroidota bacterium]
MRVEDCFFVGTVVSKYSFKGEVLLKLDTDDPEQYLSIETLFLAQDKSLVPYFVVKCAMHKQGLLRLKLEDVLSEEDANLILKAKAYLPLTELPPLTGNKFYYHEVIGFLVEDENLGILGEVTQVNEQTAQATLEVAINGKTALIPIVDDIILTIDRDAKTLHVNTPPGLIDLYTQNA